MFYTFKNLKDEAERFDQLSRPCDTSGHEALASTPEPVFSSFFWFISTSYYCSKFDFGTFDQAKVMIIVLLAWSTLSCGGGQRVSISLSVAALVLDIACCVFIWEITFSTSQSNLAFIWDKCCPLTMCFPLMEPPWLAVSAPAWKVLGSVPAPSKLFQENPLFLNLFGFNTSKKKWKIKEKNKLSMLLK